MDYKISTVINGQVVEMLCDYKSAKLLLPIFAAKDPNQTVCRDKNGTCFVAFGDDYGRNRAEV